jgi:hypothetical protein
VVTVALAFGLAGFGAYCVGAMAALKKLVGQ